MSKNYQRYFIVLTEESSEYTIAGKKALGKCVLESKGGEGKITFSVQNIKPGVICGAYIVSADGITSNAIEIGRIISDNRGKAEIKIECAETNVLNSGMALEDFNVAGMMLFKNGVVQSPLIGYRDGAIMWKNNFKIHKPTSEVEKPREAVKGAGKENTKIKEVPPKIEKTKKEQNQDSIEKANIQAIEKEQEQIFVEKLEEKPEEQNEKIHNEQVHEIHEQAAPEDFFETIEEGSAEKKFKDMAKKINNKLSEIDKIVVEGALTPEEKGQRLILSEELKGDIDMIFRNCSKIRPFKDVDNALEWVRISPSELNYLPDEFKILFKDYFISIAYRKFGHLVLGRHKHEDYISIIFGAPDVYLDKSEKAAKLSGLSQFICCDNGSLIEGKHGYWLKTVDYDFWE